MDDAIVGREVTPIVIAVVLGALVTALLWSSYGLVVGVPLLALSSAAIWRASQAGFVLDQGGLKVRPFLPSGAAPRVPWAKLQSVDVDEVVVGTETRSTKVRVRFAVEGQNEPIQLVGCSEAVAARVLERFRARGVPAHDRRVLPG